MAVNKVIYGNDTLVDLTNDTATEDDVLEGATFHDKSGVLKTGRLSVPVKDVQVDGASVVNNQGIAEIDMSGYYTDDEVDTLLAEKADVSDIPVLPTTDEQTSTTGEFETVTGGLLGECKVQLEPVQDLHGYDKPWVGGAGKNKFHGRYGFSEVSAVVYLTKGQTYTISSKSTGERQGNVRYYYDDGTFGGDTSFLSRGDTRGVKVITIPNNAQGVELYVVTDTYNVQKSVYDIQIESGSTATDYEPYENICPISGHTQANVYVVGKNRLDISSYVQKPWNGDETNLTRARGEHAIPTKVGVTYTVSVSNDFLSKYRYAVLQMSSDFPASTLSGDSSWKSTNSYTFTSLTEYIGINVRRIDYEAIDLNDLKQMQVQIELGSTATEYVSYNKSSKIYSTPFGQTVYVGTLNVLTGELTITHGMVDLGTLTWGEGTDTIGQYFVVRLSGAKGTTSGSIVADAVCSNYPIVSSNNVVDKSLAIGSTTPPNVYVRDTSYTSASDFKTAMNGVQLVYELATPIIIQLTPQQIVSLVGKNYVDALLNGQSIVEVKFKQLMSIDDIENVVGEIDTGTVITGTLTAGATSVTLSNSKITTNSMIDIYTTVYGLNPTNVTVSNGQIVLTFEAQQSNVGVKVRVS